MTPESHIELDENSKPLVNGFDELANKCSMPTLKLFFYLIHITVGLYHIDYLSDSTLVKYASYTLGYISGVISGIFAYLYAFVVPYKYEFAQEVFRLRLSNLFRVSMALMLLSLLFSMPLVNITNRIVTSNRGRKIIFIASSIGIIVTLSLFFEYINHLDNRNAYLFGYSVWGIINFIMLYQKKETRRPRLRPRTINDYFNNSLNQEDINPENLL